MAKASRIRDLWLEAHKYLGLGTMLFLAIAGLTGSLLVFRPQLDRALNPDLYRASAATPLAAAELARRFEAQQPAMRVVRLPLRAVRGRATVLGVAPRDGGRADYDEAFVDPGSGRLLGVRSDTPGWSRAQLMQDIYELHSTLLAGTPGRLFMGVVATAWLIGNLVGFYLTLPSKGPFWRKWRAVWTVSPRAAAPRVFLDLHRASGLWLFAFVVILAGTSVALNFYYEAAEPIASALSPAKPSPFDPGARAFGPAHSPRIGYSAAIAGAERDAAREAPGFRAVNALYAPAQGLYGVTFTRSGRDDYAGLGPIAFYYDDASGRFVYRDDPGRDSGGRATLRAIYPLHSGQVFGWPSRLLVFVLGLATTEMAVTGLYVWWKKRGPRAAARRARQALAKAEAA